MKTQIINPIYDAAFKYLMDDFGTASHLFSLLMECKVKVLSFLPTEHQQLREDVDGKYLSSSRLDFIADVTANGKSMRVVVELQKSNYLSSVMRFSNYLGKQYLKRGQNTQEHSYPIIAIYLLGKNLETMTEPFLRVQRIIKNIETREIIPYQNKEDFIEMLSHDMIIVQLNRLSHEFKKERTSKEEQEMGSVELKLEKKRKNLRSFFALFDQSQKIKESPHSLWIETDELDAETQQAVGRLNIALSNQQMQWELQQQKNVDDYLDSFAIQIEQERKEKETAKEAEIVAKQERIEIIERIIQLDLNIETTLILCQMTKKELEDFKQQYCNIKE